MHRNNLNNLILTEAFNTIEHKIYDKNENQLDSFIKEANNTLDTIYISNQLFNPDYPIKLLYNKKLKNLRKRNLKRASNSLKDFSIKSIKSNINLKKVKFRNNQINKNNNIDIIQKFNSYDDHRDKNKKNLNMGYNTIHKFNSFNNISEHKNNYEINTNEIIKGSKPNKNNFLIQKKRQSILKLNDDEEKIIKALKRNQIKLLKFHKKRFIKEKQREKKINEIEKEIENKTNSLFYKPKEEDNKKIKINNIDNKNLYPKDSDGLNNKNDKIESEESNNLKSLKNKKPNKSKTTENFNNLANLNYTIYKNCIKNIKFDKNFSDTVKYINKQRLSQYHLNSINTKIKSEKILNSKKKLLKNQESEINFHKRELLKRKEKELLYNHFKKQIKERFIHKNLKIDSISKIL